VRFRGCHVPRTRRRRGRPASGDSLQQCPRLLSARLPPHRPGRMTFTGTDACGNSPKNTSSSPRFEEHLFAGVTGSPRRGGRRGLRAPDRCGPRARCETATGRGGGRRRAARRRVLGVRRRLRGRPPRKRRSRHGKAVRPPGATGRPRRTATTCRHFLAHDVVHHAQGGGLRDRSGSSRPEGTPDPPAMVPRPCGRSASVGAAGRPRAACVQSQGIVAVMRGAASRRRRRSSRRAICPGEYGGWGGCGGCSPLPNSAS
jgi:hypothetical protein